MHFCDRVHDGAQVGEVDASASELYIVSTLSCKAAKANPYDILHCSGCYSKDSSSMNQCYLQCAAIAKTASEPAVKYLCSACSIAQ